MRAITFALKVTLGDGCSYQIVPKKTIYENELLNKKQFDKVVEWVKSQPEVEYRIFDEVRVPIEGNATFEIPNGGKI